MSQLILLACLAAFPLLVLVAAARDLTSYTIPNWISLALVGAFVPAAAAGWAAGAPAPELLMCLGVGAGALLAGIVMFTFGWIGGGDAKLFAASALWLGAPGLVPFLFWTAMAGGVLSIVLMVARRGRTAGGPDVERWLPQLLRPGGPVPYGLAICAGALAALRHAPLAQFAL